MSRNGFDLQTRTAPQLPRAEAGASPRWPRRELVRSRPALALSSLRGQGPRMWVFAGLVFGALASSWLEPASFGGGRYRAEEPQRRGKYLTLLGMDGRARQLRRCHRSVGPCDRVILDLLEASADQEEQRRLAELNENLLTDSSKAPA